jgi:hypothetical protein
MFKNTKFNAYKCVDNLYRQGVYDARLFITKPIPNLGVAIALLTGSLVAAFPAHAKINVPTDMSPSPLKIGTAPKAEEFTAKLLMFEEFGLNPMPDPDSVASLNTTLPVAAGCNNSPNGVALDGFLDEKLHPMPRRRVEKDDNDPNDVSPTMPNAWEAKVRECLPDALTAEDTTLYEGRPGGEWFEHQRWDEFYPKVYFQSATAGARSNSG